jgi:acetyl esterase/lipase
VGEQPASCPNARAKCWLELNPRLIAIAVTVRSLLDSIAWSRETLAALKKAGKNVTMYTYPGEHHAFGPAWPMSMARTVSFLNQRLKK